MKIIEIKQNTPEWEELRRTKIGASDCPAILKKNPYKTAFDVWEEKIMGKKPFVNEAMKRGTLLEPVAREYLSLKEGKIFSPLVVQHEDLDYMIASLDGFDGDKIIEIKCPTDKTLEKCRNGNIPEYWLIQVQHQLLVSDTQRAVLLIYDEQNPSSSLEIEVLQDLELQKEILKGCAEFYEKMINFDFPEIDTVEYELREDEDWLEAEDAYEKAKEALEAAQELEKICKESLIYLAGDRPTKGRKMALGKIFVSGRVDYSKIPEIQSLDLTPFRKKGYVSWRVRKIA